MTYRADVEAAIAEIPLRRRVWLADRRNAIETIVRLADDRHEGNTRRAASDIATHGVLYGEGQVWDVETTRLAVWLEDRGLAELDHITEHMRVATLAWSVGIEVAE